MLIWLHSFGGGGGGGCYKISRFLRNPVLFDVANARLRHRRLKLQPLAVRVFQFLTIFTMFVFIYITTFCWFKTAAHESYRLRENLLVPVSSAKSSPCAGGVVCLVQPFLFDMKEKVARGTNLSKIHPHRVSYRLS